MNAIPETLAPTFDLPACGNKITRNDISSSRLRITVAYKKYFPNHHCDILVVISDEVHLVRFNYYQDKSCVLRVGSTAMKSLRVKTGGRVRVTKLGDKAFHLKAFA